MTTENLVIVAVLLVLLAEVSYLVVKLPRQINSRKRQIFVDTSVLIDGRIIAVAQSGFVGDTLVIPRSVIGELQFLADNADHDKRTRARHGLDVVRELQDMPDVDVSIMQDGSKAEEGVDERLLTLAKKHGGMICTIDFNLNKVAVVEGIRVLNVNELAQSLRMAYLPGEKILLELAQKGQDSHQAVGYLQDGTMVVVEHASKSVGTTAEIEFIRSLQTAAGKMMFARLVGGEKKSETKKPESKRLEVRKPERKPAANVFHSDTREQQKHDSTGDGNKRNEPAAAKRPSGRAPASSRNGQGQQHSRQGSPNTNQTGRRSSNRMPSSVQREAALIDLIEKK